MKDAADTSAARRTVYRKDYKRPDYNVDDIHLTFDLGAQETACTSEMRIRRQPGAEKNAPLFLDGDELDLVSISMNGKPLSEDAYHRDEDGIRIDNPPAVFSLQIKTHLRPKENTKLQGLYESDGILCTKCETEGFRRITFFPDRPDVMARYTTTLRGEKDKLPVLLSNGNPVEKGELPDGRHYATWHDPHPKPSYLFALVAGELDHVKDSFKTRDGKDVALNLWVEKGKGDKAGYALGALKRAMRWDEKTFGRTYDLDQYSVVAVSNFNSGACENTSLNIFNDKYVMADPKKTTDTEYADIEGVIGHEYFHNWSGNRVTLANWFNLSLKEGLTVYRDQEFSGDMRGAALNRISEVARLRAGQFPEDAGPMAHPVRPDSYMSVRNVYTPTVYNKGAEVIRMQEKMLGREAFRKGVSHYFDKHAGQAVTCDDFVAALAESSGKDLGRFLETWYRQAGTPTVSAKGTYDPEQKRYTLKLKQKTPPTPGQPKKDPFIIPLETGLMGPDGADMPLKLKGETESQGTSRVLVMDKAEKTFVFEDVDHPPVLSLNRGFTAPVHVQVPATKKEQALRMRADSDLFNRWDAGQQYAATEMQRMAKAIENGKTPKADPVFIEALRSYLTDKDTDPGFAGLALKLPGEKQVLAGAEGLDVDSVHAARRLLKKQIAKKLETPLQETLSRLSGDKAPYSPDSDSAGRRAMKNVALSYVAELDTPATREQVKAAYENAGNMTDEQAAFTPIVHSRWPDKQKYVDDFYRRHKESSLVVDKWLRLQATSPAPDTLQNVKTLMDHESFSLHQPNKVRALIGGFTANDVRFHENDGSGYDFLAENVMKLDEINPQIAAGLLKPLAAWQKQDPVRQEKMKAALEQVKSKEGLSPNCFEVVDKALKAGEETSRAEKKHKLSRKARLHKYKQKKSTSESPPAAVTKGRTSSGR